VTTSFRRKGHPESGAMSKKMDYQTKFLNEDEKEKELEEENDEPWDLADRFYEKWWNDGNILDSITGSISSHPFVCA
jgi:hypothetical protein